MSGSEEVSSDEATGSATLSVRNLGGITECEVTFDPGVTVLTGHNATNRTSLLRSFGGVLGGSTATLKSDTDEGRSTLTLGGNEYTREYTRSGTDIHASGNRYTEDETTVDLFVSLLEDNPARRTVERGDDIHEIIMRPVDTEAIEARIDELNREQRKIENRIETVEQRRNRLPALEEKRRSLRKEIRGIDEELSSLRDDVAAFEADMDTAEEATELVDRLDNRHQKLNNVVDQIKLKRAEQEALHDDIETYNAELEDLSELSDTDLEEIDRELAGARERKRELDDTIASLTTIVEFNAEMVGDEADLPSITPERRDVTASLAPEAEQGVVCWTCGSHVQRGTIVDRLEDLRSVIEEKRSKRRKLEDRIAKLQDDQDEIERTRDRRNTLQDQIRDAERKLETLTTEIDELETKETELRDEIETLESKVVETKDIRDSDLLAKYERISEMQYERGQHEQRLDDIEAEIEEIEELPEKGELEAQLDELRTEIERERGRIDELESAAIDAFNSHMDEVIGVLGYGNLARVWIEKQKNTSGDGEPETVFDLHVVRETETGTAYEDVVTNLSASEREVVGLVVALAGYLVHEVYEEVPFMLLDAVEAIDAERIASLVDHFADHVPYLIVALLPEDAAVQDDTYDRISADQLTG